MKCPECGMENYEGSQYKCGGCGGNIPKGESYLVKSKNLGDFENPNWVSESKKCMVYVNKLIEGTDEEDNEEHQRVVPENAGH